MKAHRPLLAAILVSAIGVPLAERLRGQERRAADDPSSKSITHRRRVAVSRRRDRVAQFAAVDAGRPARKGRPHRLLDLHLHQLAAHTSLCPRLGREVQGSGIGGDRRALAGVRVREGPRQRSPSGEGHADRLSDRVDSDHAIWRAFTNHYWPALYFVDAQGRIRHHQFGEGEYEQSETVIQQLLSEAGASGIGHDLVSVEWRVGRKPPPTGDNLKSPENYVGYERTENFASPGGAVLGQALASMPSPRRLATQSVGSFG